MSLPNLYIKPVSNSFINETLVSIGIIVQNNRFNTVKPSTSNEGLEIPYILIDEGIVCLPATNASLRDDPNVIVKIDGKVVAEKKTTNDSPVIINGAYDLHITEDKAFIDSKIVELETIRKFYSKNTEPFHAIRHTESVVGLASGYYVAEMAYRSQSSKVVFFDYSSVSLEFQRLLIDSSDRKSLLMSRLSELTVGHRDTTAEDINILDIESIDIYYDYLKTVIVEFHNIDVRYDIEKLCEIVPNNSIVWISNVLNFITTMYHYNTQHFSRLDRLVTEKNVTLLPHTRIYYES